VTETFEEYKRRLHCSHTDFDTVARLHWEAKHELAICREKLVAACDWINDIRGGSILSGRGVSTTSSTDDIQGALKEIDAAFDQAYAVVRDEAAAAQARERKYGTFASRAVKIMRREGLVIDDLNDPMQKLAFTFYNLLVEIASRVEQSDHAALDAYVAERTAELREELAEREAWIQEIMTVYKEILDEGFREADKMTWALTLVQRLKTVINESKTPALDAALERARAEEQERIFGLLEERADPMLVEYFKPKIFNGADEELGESSNVTDLVTK